MQDSATNGGIRVTPFKRMAYVLSGLAYNRHVGPVVLAVVVGLLVHYLAPEAKGSGIPDVIGAAKRWECGPKVASPGRSTALIL